jgi:hypothetical protein
MALQALLGEKCSLRSWHAREVVERAADCTAIQFSLPGATVMIDVSDPVALRAEAERRLRLRDRGVMSFGEATPPAPDPVELARVERQASIDEKTEQLEVVKRFRVCGFFVYNLSQARASKQTPGLADLYCVHRELPLALWWESKRQVGGKYSDAQREFKAHNDRCGVLCLGGDRYDVERFLVERRLARIDAAGVIEPIPTDNLPV